MLRALAQAGAPVDPDVVAGGSLFLIVGGLMMLALVVAVVLARGLLPTLRRRPARGAEVPVRRVRPTPALPDPAARRPSRPRPEERERGRRVGRAIKAKSMDEVLGRIESDGLAQPRVANLRGSLAVLRFLDCRGCRAAPGLDAGHGCGFEVGLLEGALGRLHRAEVAVEETSCHRRGDALCQYEVRR